MFFLVVPSFDEIGCVPIPKSVCVCVCVCVCVIEFLATYLLVGEVINFELGFDFHRAGLLDGFRRPENVDIFDADDVDHDDGHRSLDSHFGVDGGGGGGKENHQISIEKMKIRMKDRNRFPVSFSRQRQYREDISLLCSWFIIFFVPFFLLNPPTISSADIRLARRKEILMEFLLIFFSDQSSSSS